MGKFMKFKKNIEYIRDSKQTQLLQFVLFTFLHFLYPFQIVLIQLLQLKMINYFLQYQQDTTPQIKKLILQSVAKKRKYEPFHIDCQITKKKLCYCVNNPVININIDRKTKQQMWKEYEQADNFFLGLDSNKKIQAQERYQGIKTKIQCLSRKEVVNFVKSIQKQKNLMGEIIQY